MTNDQEIVINKEDIVPYIYFVCSMAQRGRMYGGLSGKSDYIGGIFDRWINIIPESVIFNKYFLPKIADNLTVISDYYEYNPKKSGIAPDVLGVQVGTKARPFVEYKNKWQALDGMPQIEVKSFKKAQYMVSLRDQGYDNKYLVMVETNLDSDYLLPFFEEAVTGEDIFNKLKMDDNIFVKSNDNDDLSSVTRITRQNTDLGSIRLITVCSATDFMAYSNLCGGNESPFYSVTRDSNGLYSWNGNILDKNNKHKLLNIFIENIQNIELVKNSKSSITVYTKGNATINGVGLDANRTYIIKFQLLDRSSNNGEEYFMNKSIIERIPSEEVEMLDEIRRSLQ